jgi:hypothetical protein
MNISFLYSKTIKFKKRASHKEKEVLEKEPDWECRISTCYEAIK